MSLVRGEAIRLYEASTRYPAGFLSGIAAEGVKPGVWGVRVLSRTIRVLVLSRMPLAQRNAGR